MSPYQYKNKGTFGHFGGILHAGIHGVGTFLITFNVYVSFLDFIIHYFIDWYKMNINQEFNLKPDNSEYFWLLLGFDQFLHQLTYILIIWILI